MRFLYWNLHRKPIQKLVADLTHEHRPDVVILSECEFHLAEFLPELNTPLKQKYGLPFSPIPDPVFLVRLPRNSLKLVNDHSGVCIRRLIPPIGPDVLIIAVHLPSKLHQGDNDQALSATRLARYIEQAEEKTGHRRTLIVGDLNMNPFEDGVVGAEGLHAIMDRDIVAKKSRIVQGEERFFFYNPMWNHFGNFPRPPAGTYFYSGSKQISYFWNMFDQMMIRADLLEYFNDESLKILTSAGSTSLLNSSNRPDRERASDHLPIMFDLDLIKGV